MTSNLPPEDQPPAEWRRFTTDGEAAAQLPEFSFGNPLAVAMAFCHALDDHERYRPALSQLVTPESLPAWGDFSETAGFLRSLENVGYGSQVTPAVGDPDVVYFKILSGVKQSYQALEDQVMDIAAIVTLVWRPEYGRWLVHAIGDYLRPEEVPH
ncbi:hypothetical protein ACFQ36_02955 [Arthrobacter sp. GCM10027362]|uniref:hypothetical protein n=1 Tax=Arthrobacter sp. GCM10027362 TaxID=3273379 RepID=UPI0036347A99